MLRIHAGQEADEELGVRFVACFVQAADDAALPDDAEFRGGLRDYMKWAVGDVLSYSPSGSSVPTACRSLVGAGMVRIRPADKG
jgi:hemoglobin